MDRTDKDDGLPLFVRDHIPSRQVNGEICFDIEVVTFFCTYCHQKSMINTHMKILSMPFNVFQKKILEISLFCVLLSPK